MNSCLPLTYIPSFLLIYKEKNKNTEIFKLIIIIWMNPYQWQENELLM